VIGAAEATRILELIRLHGGRGVIRVASPRQPDEDVFVLSPEGAVALLEGPATEALTLLLSRKVWLTTQPPIEGQLEIVGVIAATD
jgi:hypothetical protein